MKAMYDYAIWHGKEMTLYKGTKAEVKGILIEFDGILIDGIIEEAFPSSYRILYISKSQKGDPKEIHTKYIPDPYGAFVYQVAVNPEIVMTHKNGDDEYKSIKGRFKYEINPIVMTEYKEKCVSPYNRTIDQCLIVSGFAGIGKSYFAEKYKDDYSIIDLDSSVFSWLEKEDGTKVKNPTFVEDYTCAIRRLAQYVDFLFISTHDEIRKSLTHQDMNFITICPKREAKDQWIERLKKRNPNDRIIPVMEENWDKFLDTLSIDSGLVGDMLVTLNGDKYLDASWLEDCRSIMIGEPYDIIIDGQTVTLNTRC